MQSGVHRTIIGLLERHERTPTLQVAGQIAKALDLPLSELIQESELIGSGKTDAEKLADFHERRKPKISSLRNEEASDDD